MKNFTAALAFGLLLVPALVQPAFAQEHQDRDPATDRAQDRRGPGGDHRDNPNADGNRGNWNRGQNNTPNKPAAQAQRTPPVAQPAQVAQPQNNPTNSAERARIPTNNPTNSAERARDAAARRAQTIQQNQQTNEARQRAEAQQRANVQAQQRTNANANIVRANDNNRRDANRNNGNNNRRDWSRNNNNGRDWNGRDWNRDNNRGHNSFDSRSWRGWHGDRDIRYFRTRDLSSWRKGRWYHGNHGGRDGWWWIVGSIFYPYSYQVARYPDPYVPVEVLESGEYQPGYWYYCDDPEGYYPYVAECFGPWRGVPQ